MQFDADSSNRQQFRSIQLGSAVGQFLLLVCPFVNFFAIAVLVVFLHITRKSYKLAERLNVIFVAMSGEND